MYNGYTVYEFRGWIIANREFMLYRDRDKIGRMYDFSCISGLFLDPELRESAPSMGGKHVVVEGYLIHRDDVPGLPNPLAVEGYCGTPFIIYGTGLTESADSGP